MMIIKILTALKGRFVGKDEYGNRYFEEKFLFIKPLRRPRRWVLYTRNVEPSKVPAEWYGWLHYTLESPLQKLPYSWIKPHQPNKTGTSEAYLPPSHPMKRKVAVKPDKGYESWQPS